ncbi:hypothetical protein BSZ39_07500 [Bowdeniella nasicola]|uniref:ABC-2 type transport system permease protein n=1 Tax=Bowdeniella nasicola TaxID=208480 RepID=A0A1Q5Q1R0_9ACTO|nr:hypothetical protein [Bowdeniella nasicola]OKL53803.1 hypothetical protein BSZ39_07500 [Bowdeniella nasicola]
MSTATPTIATAANFSTAPRLAFARVVRSEWRKFFSLRSLVITFAIAAGMGVAIPILITAFIGDDHPIRFVFGLLTQVPATSQALVLLAVGALVVSSEFKKNAAITTFVTVPQRLQVLAAKAVVVLAITLLVWATTLLTSLAAFYIRYGSKASLDDALQSITMPLLYLLFFAFIGFFFAAILRSSAGAITSAVGLIYVLPIVALMFFGYVPVFEKIAYYLPIQLTNRLFLPVDAAHPVSLTLAIVVLGVYVAVAGVAGTVLMQRRDIN